MRMMVDLAALGAAVEELPEGIGAVLRPGKNGVTVIVTKEKRIVLADVPWREMVLGGAEDTLVEALTMLEAEVRGVDDRRVMSEGGGR